MNQTFFSFYLYVKEPSTSVKFYTNSWLIAEVKIKCHALISTLLKVWIFYKHYYKYELLRKSLQICNSPNGLDRYAKRFNF